MSATHRSALQLLEVRLPWQVAAAGEQAAHTAAMAHAQALDVLALCNNTTEPGLAGFLMLNGPEYIPGNVCCRGRLRPPMRRRLLRSRRQATLQRHMQAHCKGSLARRRRCKHRSAPHHVMLCCTCTGKWWNC